MPIAPDLAALLEQVNAAPPMHTQTVEEARAAYRLMTVDFRGPEHHIEVGEVVDTEIAGLPARVYRPIGEATGGTRPTVAFLHGGGYVIGDLDTHDALCRRIARDCDAVVVAADYPLAPEHPFPAPVEAALAFVRQVHADRASYGGDDRVAVAGDSAGGNLSAVVAQELRDLPLAGQLLIYPAVDAGTDRPSLTENAKGYGLELDTMIWFVGHYAGTERIDTTDPRFAPIQGDLAGVAPAVVVTAQYDPLRDEGAAYAERLREAGVEVDHVTYDDQNHGFATNDHLADSSRAATEDLVARFGKLLHSGG